MKIIDKFDLSGKVAVVTGASKGIGMSIAEALGQQGAQVVVSSRKQEAVEEVAEVLRAQGIDCLALACHVGDPEQLQHLVEETLRHYGRIDILVNNAATNPVFGPVAKTEASAFDKIMEVNVKAPFLLGNLVRPVMKTQGGGSVINISSIGGLSPEPGLGIYSVSKAALISLTQVQAKEWGRDGIRANVICPGLIKTKFSQALWNNEQVLGHMMLQQPIQRIGEVDDVASLALFLASEAAGYCTGGVYVVDGGFTI